MLGRLLADDYQFDLDAKRMLTEALGGEAVRASDPLFDVGAFKLGDVGEKVEGERATVTGMLTARPAGADKRARLRYFYTRRSYAGTTAGRSGGSRECRFMSFILP